MFPLTNGSMRFEIRSSRPQSIAAWFEFVPVTLEITKGSAKVCLNYGSTLGRVCEFTMVSMVNGL